MKSPPTSLTDLTDHDVMLNLYLTVVMALYVTEAEPEKVELSVGRMTDTETTVDQIATLRDLMTEVERRLNIDHGDVTWTERARLQ
jgi:hypothetical protein